MASPHIAVVAFPFSSHAPKLLAVARALAAAASSATVSFLSSHDSLAQLRGPAVPMNLKFVEVSSVQRDEEEMPAWRRIELFLEAAEDGGLRQALDTAASMSDDQKVSCVVGDAFMSMAAEVGMPWVAVWTGGPSALLAHLHGDAIRADIGYDAASRCNELLTSYPGLESFRVRDLPFGDPDTGGDMFRVMSRLLHRVAERLPHAATATALNFFPGLFPTEISANIPNSLPIGPYHLIPGGGAVAAAAADKHGCLAWLDLRPTGSVAYVSFGTVAALPREELRELALGLQDAGAPFLWSLREDSWPLLPPGFLDRAAGAEDDCIGGIVVMLCRPLFGDQMMNARAVEDMWGFGMAFADDAPVTHGGLAAAVATLLAGEEGARMRATARDIQAMVVRAFEPDGGSMVNFRKFVDTVCAQV